jgi:hypothetical protein
MLSDLQTKFLNYLYHGDLDVLNLLPYNKKDACSRLLIYKNNVYQNLINTLKLTYPIILERVGDYDFQQMSKDCISVNKPLTGNLDDYGDNLSEFLKKYEKLFSYPYLSDLARLEWLKNVVFDLEDQNAVDMSYLQSLPPAKYPELKFIFNNSVHLIKSKYSLYDIYQNVGMEIKSNITFIMLYRKNFSVQIENIDKSDWNFISALTKNKTIEEAYEEAMGINPSYNLMDALQNLLLKKVVHQIFY